MPTYALRDMVEAFPAADGAIYFLRGGTHAEHVLDEPTDLDRRVLELLHRPSTRGELLAAAPGATEAELDELLGALDELGLLDTVSGDAAPPAAPLDAEALARYDRQLPYLASAGAASGAASAGAASGAEAQRRLLEATVAIVGCGALGSWTAAGLACAGVGRLVLVDDDSVELSNLNRQLLFRRGDVGRPKVEAAAEALAAFDPRIEVAGIRRRVRGPEDVEAVTAGADLIVATADDPPYAIEHWVNAVAMRRRIAHVSASQFPPFVRVGPLVRPGITGCIECQHLAARRAHPDYEALVRYRETHRRTATALGPLAALVGSVLSTDATHLLAGVAAPATQGRALIVDSRSLAIAAEPVERDPDCELCAEVRAPAAS
jgi:bacteriocin biosynthesis cyclodehydratase domain-containing protein